MKEPTKAQLEQMQKAMDECMSKCITIIFQTANVSFITDLEKTMFVHNFAVNMFGNILIHMTHPKEGLKAFVKKYDMSKKHLDAWYTEGGLRQMKKLIDEHEKKGVILT